MEVDFYGNTLIEFNPFNEGEKRLYEDEIRQEEDRIRRDLQPRINAERNPETRRILINEMNSRIHTARANWYDIRGEYEDVDAGFWEKADERNKRAEEKRRLKTRKQSYKQQKELFTKKISQAKTPSERDMCQRELDNLEINYADVKGQYEEIANGPINFNVPDDPVLAERFMQNLLNEDMKKFQQRVSECGSFSKKEQFDIVRMQYAKKKTKWITIYRSKFGRDPNLQ